MSTKKSSRFKGGKKAEVKTDSPAAAEKNSNFLQSFSRMLFLVVAVLLCAFAIYTALNTKDVTNDYIEKNLPRLLTKEAILFALIGGGFIYSAFKLIFKIAERKLLDNVVFGVVFLAICSNFMISFDKDIGSFGDNASYIINAKAMLDMGGPYKLDHVNTPFDSKAAIGLPLMLTPVVAFWGMDVVKMKALIFIMGCLSILFFFFAFKKRMSAYMAAIITILIGTYPMVIYNTTYVMTEVPFLFTLAITMYAAYVLKDATTVKRSMILGVLTALLAIFCYLTRAVGIGAIIAIMAWFFVWVPWKDIFAKKVKFTESLDVKKFVLVSMIMGVFVVGWQFRSTGSKVKVQTDGTELVTKNKSQAGSFAERNLGNNFSRNYKLCEPLWAQQVFSQTLTRWYLTLGKAKKIKTMKNGKGLALFNLFMFLTMTVGMIRRKLGAFLFFFILLITLTGSLSDRNIIFSRYIIVILPFLLYIILDFFVDGSKFLAERMNKPALAIAGTLSAITFSFIMLSHNFSGSAFNAQRQNAGDAYTIAFDNYILSAKWVKENIKDEVIVASRKPRLFYIFSEKKSMVTVYSNQQVYNKEIEEEIIQRMRDKGAKYLVLDAFSTASKKVVLPLVQNNPQLFQVVETIGETHPAFVIEFTG